MTLPSNSVYPNNSNAQPEINRAKNKEWRENNKEYVREKKKENYAENRERSISQSQAWRLANPERARQNNKTWQKNNWESMAMSRCKARAKKKGIPFDMSKSDLLDSKGNLPEFCPVFPHIKLDYSSGQDRRLWASVDRKTPNLGYIKGNVWVISWAANMWKTNGSNAEERAIIEALMRPKSKIKDASGHDQPSLFDDL
jgi:hypothetical protein